VSLRDLSDETGISLSYLEQLFAQLRRAGLVESVRGKSGGYRLARSSSQLTVGDIISAVDETVKAQGCTPDMKASCTGVGARCLTHNLWNALEDHIDSFFSSVTVADIVADKVGEMA
jgi:Rrf2 family iron-sulfur cluster assembly transcriptional regulator